MNRTNNLMESWNKKFSTLLRHANPTTYNFIAVDQMEQSSTDRKISAYMIGKQPPKRKKVVINYTQEKKSGAPSCPQEKGTGALLISGK